MPRLLLLVTMYLLFMVPYRAFNQADFRREINKAAVSLFSSLDSLQKKSALRSFHDTARIKWNNLPIGIRARAGISIGSLNDQQRKLLHRILSVSLSSQGYLKATGIMHLDNLLKMYFDSIYFKKELKETDYTMIAGLGFSHNNYFLAFFGDPSDSVWAYKIEGHHLSVNFTFVNSRLSVSPFFVGTDPAEFPITQYAGWRVLGQEEDLGIKLINLLTPSQQRKATMNVAVPQDIITGAESGKRLVDDWGIRAAEMTKQQQTLLQYILREFVFNLEYEKALVEYDNIVAAGIGKIYFGWIGSYKEEEPHYYVLNGPTFLIEFDNRSNHIHAIWREKGNEFGEDVLKKHYLSEKH